VRETDGVFVWQYPASGPAIGAIKGSPIVSGGKVYFSALDGWVYAIRNDTGAELWKKTLNYAGPNGATVQCNVEGGPALNVTGLVVASNCYNAILQTSNGIEMGDDMQIVQGKPFSIAYRTTPAVDPVLGRIYTGSDNHYLYSEDVNLGDRWNFSTGRQVRSSPAVSKDKFAQYVFFGSDDGKLYGVKTGGGGLLRGTKLWDLDTGTPVTTSISLSDSTPAPGDTIDIIFTAQYPAINSVMIGGKAASAKGPLRWNASYTIPTASGTSSVNIASNHELGSSFTRVLKVTVDAAAGTVAFDDLSTEAFALMTPVRSTPAVDSKNVYFAAENGTVMAVRISDGSVAWRYPSGSLIRGSPAVAGGKVYIGTQDGKLYALAQPAAEKIPPTWSNQVQGQDKVGVGGTIMLSVDLADDTALASATLSTDETGA
jgi:outer membrane protein assembly factor BamB